MSAPIDIIGSFSVSFIPIDPLPLFKLLGVGGRMLYPRMKGGPFALANALTDVTIGSRFISKTTSYLYGSGALAS